MPFHFKYLERGLDATGFLRGLLAITTSFLWLLVPSLLKAISMKLATFVLAILQISKDIILLRDSSDDGCLLRANDFHSTS